MSRWIAACFMVIAAVAVTTAQPAKEEKKTIEVAVDENKDWVWTLPASGAVSVTDLLALYASCRDVLILFNEKAFYGSTSFQGQENRKLKGDQIDIFVANCLEEFRMALTKAGANQYRIIPSAETITKSSTITEDELAATPAWQWVTLIYRPATIEENSLRGALQNMTSRQGGAINPVAGGGLLICDRADRVREIYKAATTLDEGLTPEIKSHDVPEGVNADDAVKALRDLFGTDQKYRYYMPTFARATGDASVIVRGTAELQAEVAQALKVMK
jgi:hypothetical protein